MAVKKVIEATTQDHLEIEDVLDNLVLLKDGSAAMIITTTAVNFGLLSESEQDATIYAYAALLNSLTFPIQIVIRSNKKDITGYEKLLAEQEQKAIKPENKDRIRKYREFIEETVRQRNVLDKKFYVIIPFYFLELGVAKSASAVVKSGRANLPFPKEYIVGRAKMTLEPKRDHIIHQLSRLGLRARQLTTKEIIQLFFEIYNPDSSQGQILADSKEYETPIVQPAIGFKDTQESISSPDNQIPTPITQNKTDQKIVPSLESPILTASKPNESARQTTTNPEAAKTQDPQTAIDSALKEIKEPSN
jgi:hypothetical protein